MRYAVIFLSAGLLCTGSALAQSDAPPSPPAQTDGGPPPGGGGPRGGGPQHRVEMLQRALDLSTEQTTQVRALFATERSKMDTLHGNTALSAEDRRSQMTTIHQDTNAKLRALLTPDQVTKYNAMEARMKEHRPGDMPPPPPNSSGPDER